MIIIQTETPRSAWMHNDKIWCSFTSWKECSAKIFPQMSAIVLIN